MAAPERTTLLDAEPVLLVHDRDRERAELDLDLDKRVRADGQVGLPAREPLAAPRAAGPPAASW